MSNLDFNDFKHNDSNSPGKSLDLKIFNYVRSEIDPSVTVVFSKLIGVQALIGFITLTFCPQFSLSLTNNHELFHYLHYQFGKSICMAICGSIFIGTGAVVSAYLLKSSEIQKVRRSSLLYYFSITSIALAFFTLLGPNMYLKLAGFWFIGAFIAGISMLELNFYVRQRLI